MSAHGQISIVGAGIAGLVLARCLLHRGIKATIYEKARCSAHRNNYGITLYSKSYRPLLEVLGLDETAFRRRVAVDAPVGGSGRVGAGDADSASSFHANRNRFESLLAEGLNVQWERQVDAVRSRALDFSDGTSISDLAIIVGADGPHSKVREAVAPGAKMKVLPFAVYNGKRRISREEFEQNLRAHANGVTPSQRRIGTSMFQVSVNDVGVDEVGISYTYSRPALEGNDPLFRPARSKDAAKEMPSELFQELEGLRSQLPPFLGDLFNPDAMQKDRLLNWLMRSMQVDLGRLQDSAKDGLVLVGDAVHAEPILGPSYGANEAIEDSMTLGNLLMADMHSPIRQFYEERFGKWQEAVSQSEDRIREIHSRSTNSL